jgi:hypothetical protein
MSRKYVNVLLAAAAILFSCDQDGNPVSGTQKIEYPQGGSTASAFIRVLDSYRNVPVKGVVVTIEGCGSCSTNVDGIARFDELRIGTYMVNASCAGYETVVSTVAIYDNGNSTVPMPQQAAMDMQISRKGVVVIGKIYYQKENALYPVSQQQVELAFLTGASNYQQQPLFFQRPVRSVKTLPDGSYYFDSVPENTAAFLRVKKYFAGGLSYAQLSDVTVNSGLAGDTIFCIPVILKPESYGYFTILGDNSDSITVTDSFKITFSEPVDTSKFATDKINIVENNTSSNSKILLSTQWNKTLTVLSIRPFGGIWKEGSAYTIYISNLLSISGKNLYSDNYPGTFTVLSRSAGSDVKNLHLFNAQSIDYYTSSVQLQWSRLSGVRAYEIYCRVQGDSVWKSNNLILFSSDTVGSLSTYGIFSNGKFIDVMVLGVYEDGKRSDPATAKILTLKDRSRPLITSGSATSTYAVYDFNNTSSQSVIRQLAYPVQFSEPMDTTKKPVVTVKEASYSYSGDTMYTLPADSIRYNWLSQTQMVLRAFIPALKNAAYDSVLVDLRNVKDISGNSVSFSDTLALPIIKYVTR